MPVTEKHAVKALNHIGIESPDALKRLQLANLNLNKIDSIAYIKANGKCYICFLNLDTLIPNQHDFFISLDVNGSDIANGLSHAHCTANVHTFYKALLNDDDRELSNFIDLKWECLVKLGIVSEDVGV